MKVKTYKNRSLQEGLEDIKRDLGNEALILSTRSVSERPRFSLFKRQAWEITAALDEAVAPQPSPSGRGQTGEADRVRASEPSAIPVATKTRPGKDSEPCASACKTLPFWPMAN